MNLLRRIQYRIALPLVWRIKNRALPSFFRDRRMLESTDEDAEADLLATLKRGSRNRFFFNPLNRKDFFLNILTRTQTHDEIIADGDRVVQNEYDLLGSGPIQLESPLRWQRDFKSGKEWPLRRITRHDLLDLGSDSDIKIPWELARFHQVWWLGKAYWLSNNQEYALKFQSMILDWIENNPPGKGIHWTTAMENAIRVCNWIAGMYFFLDSDQLSEKFWERFLASLLEHGEFIDHHLEYSAPSGNHLVGGLAGLFCLGIVFQDTRRGRRWLGKAHRELEAEIQREVYRDGVHFEKSIAYHRFVTELLLLPFLLGRLNHLPFSNSYRDRLVSMFEFLAVCVGPDGSVPRFGDDDDGRLFRFASHPPPADYRSTLGIGAVLFQRPEWKTAAQSFSQDALWMLGAEGFEQFLQLGEKASTTPESRLFPEGGFAFLNSESARIAVRTGDVGKTGKPGHGHSDTCSFEFWIDGERVLVDSGTYCYSSDIQARNWFRSAAAHNTLTIDERDFVEYDELWKVRRDETHPAVTEWSASDHRDVLELRRALKDSVTHVRRFEFEKGTRQLIVRDTVTGNQYDTIQRYLHFAPHIKVTQPSPLHIRAEGSAIALDIILSPADVILSATGYSEAYGRKTQKQTVTLRNRGPLAEELLITIRPAV